MTTAPPSTEPAAGLLTRVADTRTAQDRAAAVHDQAIRDAAAAGHPLTSIASALGVTNRKRLYTVLSRPPAADTGGVPPRRRRHHHQVARLRNRHAHQRTEHRPGPPTSLEPRPRRHPRHPRRLLHRQQRRHDRPGESPLENHYHHPPPCTTTPPRRTRTPHR